MRRASILPAILLAVMCLPARPQDVATPYALVGFVRQFLKPKSTRQRPVCCASSSSPACLMGAPWMKQQVPAIVEAFYPGPRPPQHEQTVAELKSRLKQWLAGFHRPFGEFTPQGERQKQSNPKRKRGDAELDAFLADASGYDG